MKNAKIVLVAAWEGWCSACAVERPLVLTRAGRLGVRTWLTAPVAETLPLTLTCRLCGSSSLVPSEQDDPPVLVGPDELVAVPATLTAAQPAGGDVPRTLTTVLPAADDVRRPAAPPADPELERARTALGTALSALLADRTARANTLADAALSRVPGVSAPASASPAVAAPVTALAPRAVEVPVLAVPRFAAPAAVPAPAPPAVAAPLALPVPAVAASALPVQRSSSSDADGLATLQLLADGLDLLSSTRA